MRNKDIETIKEVKDILSVCLSSSDKEIFKETLDNFENVYNRLYEKNKSEKEHYQNNSQKHKDYTKNWKSENPERAKNHQQEYQTRKKAKKQSVLEQIKSSDGTVTKNSNQNQSKSNNQEL